MKHLRKFNSLEDFERNQGAIPRPWVAYVEGHGVKYGSKYTPSPQRNVPLYVEAIEDLTVKFAYAQGSIQYSLDNSEWIDLPGSTATPTIAAGSKVYFRASGLTPSSSYGIGTFTISAAANIGGNAMSMIVGEDYESQDTISVAYALYRLFYNATTIVDASRLALPATTLASYAYSMMFYSCSKLEYPPELPATTLGTFCYYSMFLGCAALRCPPELPATTLTNKCYRMMFQNCSSLEYAPQLPATTIAEECYYAMFMGCAQIAAAPALPATEVFSACYQSMFHGTAIKYPPALPAISLINKTYAYHGMFKNCANLVEAPELPATTLSQACYREMFYGCTKLVNAPELPAKSLATDCYRSMFQGCTKLAYIKAMFTTSPSSSYLSSWVSGVPSEGTFVKNAAATWADTFGTSAIPTGWTVETAEA